MTYTYDAGFTDPGQTRTISEKFTGFADLFPVDGGFEGNSTGSYHYAEDVVGDAYGCHSEYHTITNGDPDMVVHYQYSIDNHVTGGPDTSMYNSSYGVVEVLIDSSTLHWEDSSTYSGDRCGDNSSNTGEDGSVGFGCFFYSLDFDKGGTFTSENQVTNDTNGKCVLTIGQSVEKLHIFGTVKGLIDGTCPPLAKCPAPISNSKVVVDNMENMAEPYLKKLSTSKPNFEMATATTDDDDAKYEFEFEKDPGKLPRLLVVSLLWYEGKPEFAVTNGNELEGRFIPVYQALCVDDFPGTKCEKWERTASGYEAEVNFEYGSAEKLGETMTIMEMEDWKGGNATLQVMGDSAYIYYNSYRAAKYFETLDIPVAWDPVMIKSHHEQAECGAYYDAPAKLSNKYPYFGDLGTSLEKVKATGAGVYICDSASPIHVPDAPMNREWHELGHYMMFQLYPDPYVRPYGTPHQGYLNSGTNDSIIEGFAEFVAMLINEYYGNSTPYMYPVGPGNYNLETDYKVWGPWIHEEFSVAGILWDFHDAGNETNPGLVINGTLVGTSKVIPNLADKIASDAKTILGTINDQEPKTIVELYHEFLNNPSGSDNLNMIFVNHGAFADIEEWNNIHDSFDETISETGNTPNRVVRKSTAPELPGSNLVSNIDSSFNITISHIEPFSYYDYSYLVDMKGGEPTYFAVPPEYYPSTVIVTPLSKEGNPLPGAIEINSDEYWNYIRSNPPQDGVFRNISVEGSDDGNRNVTSLQYIQNIRELLSHVSTEYKAGNNTGALALATAAYLDNFEYIEPELEQRNATQLKEDTEKLLRDELVGLIRDGGSSETVDAKIADINAKLDEAIVIVPEFPPGITLVMTLLLITMITLLARFKGKIGFNIP